MSFYCWYTTIVCLSSVAENDCVTCKHIYWINIILHWEFLKFSCSFTMANLYYHSGMKVRRNTVVASFNLCVIWLVSIWPLRFAPWWLPEETANFFVHYSEADVVLYFMSFGPMHDPWVWLGEYPKVTCNLHLTHKVIFCSPRMKEVVLYSPQNRGLQTQAAVKGG